MKFVFKKLALAGAIAVVFATPAMAAVSASASISNMSITLYDLNPLDGIAPMITWSNSSYDYHLGTSTSSSVYGPYGSSNSYNYAPFGEANSSSASIYNASASASVAASAGGAPSTLYSATGSATATDPSGSKSFNAAAQNAGYGNSLFTLSANTVVVFRANASTQATASVGYDYLSGQNEYASAQAFMSVSGPGASGNGSQSSSDSTSSVIQNYYWGSGAPANSQSSVILAGSFVNTSNVALSGMLQLGASVNGSTNVVASSIAAVPEPESYAMFLAGLGLIGAMARRRQSR